MGPSSPSFSSEIEKLFQRSVSPETSLSDSEREFLGASYAILELNYTVGRKPLYEFADTGWRIRINSYDR
jgi:hypothetical protein